MAAFSRIPYRLAAGAAALVFSLVCAQAQADTALANPYLADSAYPIGHTNSAQVDSTLVPGPLARAHALAANEIEYARIGPGHLGNYVSAPYPDGRRVIWSNGPRDIVKLDYDSFKVLATYPLPGAASFTPADAEEVTAGLASAWSLRRLYTAFSNIRRMLPADLSSVYCLLDRDGNFYAGNAGGLTVYGDARPGDPASPINVRRQWKLPRQVRGSLVGMNLTYDGWLVMATDFGYVLAVSRDLAQTRWVALPHNDEAPAYNERMAGEKRQGYNWIRNAVAVDESGGIYVAANGWMQKIAWNGHELSTRTADGAWTEPYANGTGTGTGATPVLMGFGDSDRLVVITDGEPLMNLTLYWRDAIPAGWQAPAGGRSPRMAALLPVTMGDPARRALQSEQAVTVAGYGMVVVNNEPASMPFYIPNRAKGLLISLLAEDPAYTPHGMEKFDWDPARHQLRRAWTNREVSSPNCVPYISLGSNRVYTVGVQQDHWALEAVALDSGASAASYAIGGSNFNTMFSGIYLDEYGRVVYGGMFGAVRLAPGAAQ